jgi:hypothetical protein
MGRALPKARDSRPRQNSQERSLNQPGCARSITSASRAEPSTCSMRRISSKVPRFIAWATIRSVERGASPTGPAKPSSDLPWCCDRGGFGRGLLHEQQRMLRA